ncbi:lysine-specific demethylase 4A isoform X2 [Salmo salar]|uniref:[histone H3]-trimethyl-L-lysine(9) demethylase n=1 Tax=Salmo salar TaxID=8030 RepID=A0A1S3R0R5_SALSA|nr:lysine-specific demethylase 4A isoform X2 [Salmo salar]|eukprot:XP_014045457.1 PREDICTED: lysine-specific demethylase 4A-like isoform X2 [Salmo salar]
MSSDSGSQTPGSKGIMTFHPTAEEFQNFSRYIAYMEYQGAHQAGLAKVVPPKDWKPRKSYDDIDDLVIPAPIQQVMTGQSGLFTQYNIQKKPMTVREFRKTANSDKFCSPRYANFEELERKYWKKVTNNPPIYGADVNGTLYDPDVTDWNIGKLNTILDTVEHANGITIEGVNTPYLYFGMWKTTFAWHTEDMDLYSINYLHFGAPKSWYCVPPEQGKKMERLAQGFFPGSHQNCEAFLRHKMTLISPSILRKYGIPFEKITQEPGEFMVTFPYSYHAGFNHGFNCAESTNFATERWIEYGKQAMLCTCRKDMVKISMDLFVKNYQPDRYEQWLAGRDTGPIDHSRPTPEAKEFLGEEQGKDCISKEPYGAELNTQVERKSPTPRIGTKRHWVCLDVPDKVVPKDEEEEEYEKKARLGLTTLDTGAEDCTDTDTPVKLTPRELPNLKTDPTKGNSSTSPAPQKVTIPSTSNHAATILAQPQSHRNGHLPVVAPPARTGPSAQPVRKLGVASLLFHKTQSPKENLQVHSYARENQQPIHHTQLHVHSYAREHLPRHLQPHLQLKAQLQSQVKAGQQESQVPFTKDEHIQAEAQSPSKGEQVETKAQTQGLSKWQQPGEAQAREEKSEAKAPSSPEPVQTHAHTRPTKRAEVRRDSWKRCLSPVQAELTLIKQTNFNLSKPMILHPSKLTNSSPSKQTDGKRVKSKQCPLLRQLPKQHPLLSSSESHSDDDELYVDMKDEPEEMEEWAKPLAQLWQSRPYNPQAERSYNQRMGLQAPYCSICLLFHTYDQSQSSSNPSYTVKGRRGGRQRSKPLIPEMCFSTTNDKTNSSSAQGQLYTPHLEEDGTSLLVSCSQCCVRIHASCYGVSVDQVSDDWMCARCEANALTEDCCLCSLRGGALQRANNDKWVHVLCSLVVLEARFVNIAERSPVDLSYIPLARFQLKCFYCKRRVKRDVGCCVQCSHGRCTTAFHPTCAQAAGQLMQPDDWPFIVHVTCYRHKSPVLPERNKAAMQELEVGQQVICKHKNGRYYQCEVLELTTATFYEVVFDDGSYSDNLFPEDIENRDCVKLGPPAVGDVVQVRWTDNLLYGAKFVASHSILMYQMEFEDGSSLSAKREDVYSLDEELPKRVKSRMSKASDMRFDGIFTEKEVKQGSKRQRVINSRYREDYIEPLLYRVMME